MPITEQGDVTHPCRNTQMNNLEFLSQATHGDALIILRWLHLCLGLCIYYLIVFAI